MDSPWGEKSFHVDKQGRSPGNVRAAHSTGTSTARLPARRRQSLREKSSRQLADENTDVVPALQHEISAPPRFLPHSFRGQIRSPPVRRKGSACGREECPKSMANLSSIATARAPNRQTTPRSSAALWRT